MEQCNLYAITSSTDDRCQGKSACVMKLNNCKEPPLPKANNHLIIQMSRVCRFAQRTYPGLSPISFLVLYAVSFFSFYNNNMYKHGKYATPVYSQYHYFKHCIHHRL